MLVQELRKIEARKRDRDRKTQDLQKLISAVDKQNDNRKSMKIDKKTPHHRKRIAVPIRPTRVDPNVICIKINLYSKMYTFIIVLFAFRTLRPLPLNFQTLKIVVYLLVLKG